MPDGPPSCPQCHSPIHSDWPYCSHCGSRLWSGPIPPPAIPICGHCGAQVDPTGSFCWWCGVPLSTGKEPFIPASAAASAKTGSKSESVGVVSTPPPRGPSPKESKSQAAFKLTPKRSLAGSLLLGAGIAILLLSLFLGWYAISATAVDNVSGSNSTYTASATLYPLDYLTESYTCQGSSSCPATGTSYAGSYSYGGFSGVGSLYGAVAGLVVAGVGLAAGAIALAFTGGYRRSIWAGRLAILAIILIVLAPTILFAVQPSVLNAQGGSSGGASPQSSFAGSCSGSGCGNDIAPGTTTSASWGPSIGWFLGLVALIPLLLGWLEIRTHRKRSVSVGLYKSTA
jgi:Double zinc ribbon